MLKLRRAALFLAWLSVPRASSLTAPSRIRAAIEGGTLDALLGEWDRDAEKFRELRKTYLLY